MDRLEMENLLAEVAAGKLSTAEALNIWEATPHGKPDARAVAVEDAAALTSEGERKAATLLAAGDLEASIIRKQGQTKINLMWETTQMRIALLVVLGVTAAQLSIIAVILFKIALGDFTPDTITLLVSVLGSIGANAALVIGFYFSRTNHTKIGGIGITDTGR